jgi:guanylate kinase
MGAKGLLLVIDGPSAVGKSTILRAVLEQQRVQFNLAKRLTTRMKRSPDDDDDIYDFISHEEFTRLVNEGGFIEHKCYKFGMCYGLPKRNVLKQLDEGKHVLAMINLGNIREVTLMVPNSFGVFLSASLETIRQRLVERGSHPPEQIEERLGNAAESFKYISLYNLVMVNEHRSVSSVVDEIIEKFMVAIEKASV